jgi:hypothetical protein
MALVLGNGTALLHIPKTGGTWAARVVAASGIPRCALADEHADAAVLRAQYPDARVITFVRHPLAWWPSVWAALVAPGRQVAGGRFTAWGLDLAAGLSFPRFMETVLAEHPGACSALFARFAVTPELTGRTEHLTGGLERALRAAGVLTASQRLVSGVARANVTAAPAPVWPPALARAVAAAEAEAIGCWYRGGRDG